MNLSNLYSAPIFGAGITIIAYVIGTACQRRWHWLHPLLVTCGLLIGCLLLLHIPYSTYRNGGSLISAFLAPATVSLAVPLYHHARRIREHLKVIMISCALGALFGVISSGLTAYLAGAPHQIVLSVLPKSATAPICIEVVRQLGGVPELGALAAVISGLLGSIIGLPLLRALGIRNDIAIGAAIGTSSHGIGTARLLRESEFLGGVSALAMTLTGIFTALMTPLLQWWFK